jgi:hypothetical protein
VGRVLIRIVGPSSDRRLPITVVSDRTAEYHDWNSSPPFAFGELPGAPQ